MDIFKLYFELNIIDNIINLMPIMLFRLSSCICLQAKFPWDISMIIFFFFFFLVKLQYRPDLKAIFFGHVGVIDAHRDF